MRSIRRMAHRSGGGVGEERADERTRAAPLRRAGYGVKPNGRGWVVSADSWGTALRIVAGAGGVGG